MSFKPANSNVSINRPPREKGDFVVPVPEEGTQFVAASLLIDLGTQERESYNKTDDKGKEILDDEGNPIVINPKPAQQVALYADLLNDKWDYGGDIGEKQIRLPIHGEFAGEVTKPINFVEVAPRDPKGNYIKGQPWTLAPNSRLAKVAKACGAGKILEPGTFENPNDDKSDITQILGKPFMMEVQVKRKEVEKDGETIEYINSYIKNPIPPMKGIPVPELECKPMFVTFDSPVEEIIEVMQTVRANVKRKIMKALNYENVNYTDENAEVVPSNMKIAFDQMGLNQWGFVEEDSSEDDKEEEKAPAKKKAAPKKAASKKAASTDEDDDDPF